MRTAARMIRIAADRPAEAAEDLVGLAAICVLVFVGFAATAMG